MSKRGPITSHILDLSRGKPAADVEVQLEFMAGSQWQTLGRGTTNSDGRVETLLSADAKINAGLYRLTFATAAYFQKSGAKTFYPQVSVTFAVENTQEHYHVPLLLSPFG